MKKMAPWLITMLLAITLIVMAAFLLVNQMTKPNSGNEVNTAVQNVGQPAQLSADELVKVTSSMDGIKTNLSDPNYVVVMNFAFQLIGNRPRNPLTKLKISKSNRLLSKRLPTRSRKI